MPADDISAGFSRLAGTEGGADGAGGARVLGIDLGGSCGLETISDPMKLFVTGLNHRTAPGEVREKFAFEDAALRQAVGNLNQRPGLLGGMIVCPGNRVEVAG